MLQLLLMPHLYCSFSQVILKIKTVWRHVFLFGRVLMFASRAFTTRWNLGKKTKNAKSTELKSAPVECRFEMNNTRI